MGDLLAEGKAVPMVVVVPEAHALPTEDILADGQHTLFGEKSAGGGR